MSNNAESIYMDQFSNSESPVKFSHNIILFTAPCVVAAFSGTLSQHDQYMKFKSPGHFPTILSSLIMEPSSQSHGACHHHHFRLIHCSHHHHHHQHCHHNHNQHHHHHHHPLGMPKPHYLLPITHNPVFHPNLHTTLCPLRYTSPPPIPSQTQFSIPVSAPDISNLEVLEEPQLWEEEDVGEGEEEVEEEPMFVMTDEWMEFFAKSKEKRRLEKKQAKMLKKAEKKNKKEGE